MVRKYPNGDIKEEKNFSGGAVDAGTEKTYAMVNPEEKVDVTPGLTDKTSKVSTDKPNEATKKVPDGYNKLYNVNKQISEDGEFKGGKLQNGKKYIYDKNGLLDKIEIYKAGKYAGDAQID
jgi:antitoxin component YwqK of YwqJK toxin-antitoxin module